MAFTLLVHYLNSKINGKLEMEAEAKSQNIANNIHFITSNKGHPMLVMNEYVYKCNRKTPNKKYWLCTVKGCNVYVHTDVNNNYLSGGEDHDHLSNPESIEVKQTRQLIKERAINELTPIGQIYDEEMTKSDMNPMAVAVFPTVREMCKFTTCTD